MPAMRRLALPLFCLALGPLAACGGPSPPKSLDAASVIDETNLNDIMLTVADPAEAVTYFSRLAEANPDRIDLKRGLAQSLIRADRAVEAVAVWSDVTAAPDATDDDRVALADALIRTNDWARATATLDAIPPTHATFDRYRLEAMVADSRKDWTRADSFYDIAAGMTRTPASIYNNWGFSKLTRGDYPAAERLFQQALVYQPDLFTAKNNLVLARGAQRTYDLPVIAMTQTERANLLYTLALTAIKQGDVTVGKGLLQQAIETHPQYFEAAERSLAALEG
jgi:Flp pilus assembly protein TadD